MATIPSFPVVDLNISGNSTGFAAIIKQVLEFIQGDIWGEAAFRNIFVDDATDGEDSTKLVTRAQLGTAAFEDTGAGGNISTDTENNLGSAAQHDIVNILSPRENNVVVLEATGANPPTYKIPASLLPDSAILVEYNEEIYGDTGGKEITSAHSSLANSETCEFAPADIDNFNTITISFSAGETDKIVFFSETIFKGAINSDVMSNKYIKVPRIESGPYSVDPHIIGIKRSSNALKFWNENYAVTNVRVHSIMGHRV